MSSLRDLGTLLHGSQVGPTDLEILRDKLYFDRGPQSSRRDALVRFVVLLVLSTVIAAGGVIADSTATVIGAMIIAPLMTPIMAMALAIVTGDGRALVRAALTVVLGAVLAIAIGMAVGALAAAVDTSTNAQILGRVTPRLIDLVIAVATGAVAGFALSRENVSDTLPGVAIAISLVPPLAVVGITLQARAFDDAAGALLLFGTNVLAILAAGGAMLGIMGYRAAARTVDDRHRKLGIAVVAVGVAVILLPLAAHTVEVGSAFVVEQAAKQAAETWATPAGFEVAGAVAADGVVTVTVAGDGRLPPTGPLVAAIREADPTVGVDVRVLDAQLVHAAPPLG